MDPAVRKRATISLLLVISLLLAAVLGLFFLLQQVIDLLKQEVAWP